MAKLDGQQLIVLWKNNNDTLQGFILDQAMLKFPTASKPDI